MINKLITEDQLLNQKIIITVKYQSAKTFKKTTVGVGGKKEINTPVHSHENGNSAPRFRGATWQH